MNSEEDQPASLHVHFLPALVSPDDLANNLVVMIDLLRASTTIIHALENGATKIIPCETVEETKLLQTDDSQSVLLGGERGGEMIPGFDLDNSPFSYTEKKIKDKTILFTTTNGTKALKHACKARRILIGAFVNLDAVCSEIKKEKGAVHFLCAGTNGQISSEDVVCAGAMVHQILSENNNQTGITLNDQAQIAENFYRSTGPAQIEETVRKSGGGLNLIKLGMDADINRSSEMNRFQSVPEFFPSSNCIQNP
jgi:2-phosphosulfolactate phosphatase